MLAPLFHLVHLLRYSIKTLGPLAMARGSLRWVRDPAARNVDSGFDSRYGTDTNADLTPLEARLPLARRATATMYIPSMDCDVRSLLNALPWTDALRASSTFIDLGSGKGRAVFLAAQERFREVIGVELSPVLHATATDNLALLERGGALVSPVTFVQGDATEVNLPGSPVILYLYHPFQTPVLQEVLDRVHASLDASPRPVALLYCHPTVQTPISRDVFEASGRFERVELGVRTTKHHQIGWSVFTNSKWLEDRAMARAMA